MWAYARGRSTREVAARIIPLRGAEAAEMLMWEESGTAISRHVWDAGVALSQLFGWLWSREADGSRVS